MALVALVHNSPLPPSAAAVLPALLHAGTFPSAPVLYLSF
jgi:hypothetical protein